MIVDDIINTLEQFSSGVFEDTTRLEICHGTGLGKSYFIVKINRQHKSFA